MSRLEQKYRYYAFISYNHRDEREAKWLQRQLEHYRLPSVARKEIGEDIKIRPVFRYAVNLSLGDLRRQVKEELDASKFLIVVCSPNSAQPNIEGKHWVNDEVTHFIEAGRVDDIIPVIVDGEPNVGGVRECFVIARSDGAWNPRYYMDLLRDDNGVTIIASFDSFPNKREAAAMRMFGGDIAAVHNIAVLEWMHCSFRTGMDPRRIKRYLEEAKRLEVPTAEANLKILLDHIPQGAIDEAPYTIEIL